MPVEPAVQLASSKAGIVHWAVGAPRPSGVGSAVPFRYFQPAPTFRNTASENWTPHTAGGVLALAGNANSSSAGTLQTVQETYEPGDAGHSPVMPPINVLPVSLPAFLASAPKGQFKYTSQPTGQAKDVTAKVKFAHAITQDVRPASAKSLESVPRGISKSLEKTPAVEVHLGSPYEY